MGEFLYSVFGTAGFGIHKAAGRAVLVVIIAFCFQLFYMLGTNSKNITHAIRRVGLRTIFPRSDPLSSRSLF